MRAKLEAFLSSGTERPRSRCALEGLAAAQARCRRGFALRLDAIASRPDRCDLCAREPGGAQTIGDAGFRGPGDAARRADGPDNRDAGAEGDHTPFRRPTWRGVLLRAWLRRTLYSVFALTRPLLARFPSAGPGSTVAFSRTNTSSAVSRAPPGPRDAILMLRTAGATRWPLSGPSRAKVRPSLRTGLDKGSTTVRATENASSAASSRRLRQSNVERSPFTKPTQRSKTGHGPRR